MSSTHKTEQASPAIQGLSPKTQVLLTAANNIRHAKNSSRRDTPPHSSPRDTPRHEDRCRHKRQKLLSPLCGRCRSPRRKLLSPLWGRCRYARHEAHCRYKRLLVRSMKNSSKKPFVATIASLGLLEYCAFVNVDKADCTTVGKFLNCR